MNLVMEVLAVLAILELGVLNGVVIRLLIELLPSGRRSTLLPPPETSENEAEEERRARAERRHSEGLNSILGYDMNKAREAVRHDAEDRDEE